MMSNSVCRAPVCELPEGRPVRDVLVFERVSPLQGDTLLQVTLYVVNLLVGKVWHTVFIDLRLNDLEDVDILEITVVIVKTLRERILVVLQLYYASP